MSVRSSGGTGKIPAVRRCKYTDAFLILKGLTSGLYAPSEELLLRPAQRTARRVRVQRTESLRLAIFELVVLSVVIWHVTGWGEKLGRRDEEVERTKRFKAGSRGRLSSLGKLDLRVRVFVFVLASSEVFCHDANPRQGAVDVGHCHLVGRKALVITTHFDA